MVMPRVDQDVRAGRGFDHLVDGAPAVGRSPTLPLWMLTAVA